jgi:hypothetical protein
MIIWIILIKIICCVRKIRSSVSSCLSTFSKLRIIIIISIWTIIIVSNRSIPTSVCVIIDYIYICIIQITTIVCDWIVTLYSHVMDTNTGIISSIIIILVHNLRIHIIRIYRYIVMNLTIRWFTPVELRFILFIIILM